MTFSATVCGISARYNLNDPTMVYPLLLLSVKSWILLQKVWVCLFSENNALHVKTYMSYLYLKRCQSVKRAIALGVFAVERFPVVHAAEGRSQSAHLSMETTESFRVWDSVHTLVSAAFLIRQLSLLFIDTILFLLWLCGLAAVFLPPRELG